MMQVLVAQNTGYCNRYRTPDRFRLGRSFTENTKQTVHADCYQHEVPDIEGHSLGTRHDRVHKLIGEIGQRQTILVESHPEEDYNGEYKTERYNTFLRLLRTQLLYFLTARCSLFSRVLYVFEPRTASIVDRDTQYQRRASYCKSKVVTVVHAHAQRLVCPSHDLHSGCRREHSAYIDRHVEQRESCIATIGIRRIIVQITYHHLQVTLEKSRTERDQYQRTDHAGHGECRTSVLHAAHRDREQHIAQEHNDNTDRHALAVSDLVGDDTTNQR